MQRMIQATSTEHSEPAAGAPAHSISVQNVTKRYGDTAALDDVSLEITRGSFVTLPGPSVLGKTTLLMTIAGFTRPDRGSLQVDRRDITDLEAGKPNFRMVFQGYALFPHLTVARNVALYLAFAGARGRMAEKIRRALEVVQPSGLTTDGHALRRELPRQEQLRGKPRGCRAGGGAALSADRVSIVLPADAPAIGKDAPLAIRPERIAPRATGGRLHRLEGAAGRLGLLYGSTIQCRVDAALGSFQAQLAAWGATVPLARGETVWLAWSADAGVVVADDR